MGSPEVPLPAELERLVSLIEEARFRERIRESARYGLRLEVRRVGDGPLVVGTIGKLFGKKAAVPKLSPMDSKYGGVPYLEDVDHWPGDGDDAFIGQLNFEQLPTDGVAMPHRGLFVVFAGPEEPFYHCRWYPEPAREKHTERQGPCAAKWECAVVATRAVSVCTDIFWEQDAGTEALEEGIESWIESHGANACCWLGASIAAPGPRDWFGSEKSRGQRDSMRLWTPADQNASDTGLRYGSMTESIMIAAADLADGRLEHYGVLIWQ